jgi:hypothetical protein
VAHLKLPLTELDIPRFIREDTGGGGRQGILPQIPSNTLARYFTAGRVKVVHKDRNLRKAPSLRTLVDDYPGRQRVRQDQLYYSLATRSDTAAGNPSAIQMGHEGSSRVLHRMIRLGPTSASRKEAVHGWHPSTHIGLPASMIDNETRPANLPEIPQRKREERVRKY